MAISLKHRYQSGIADSTAPSDNTKIKPSHWNSEHDLRMSGQRILGRKAADVGVVQELTGTDIAGMLGGQFATVEQGAKADTAVQPGDLGSAATHGAEDFATASQGAKADSALQPGSVVAVDVESRAWAIANHHPEAASTFLCTAGFQVPGDGGAARYKKVASQPSHPGKLSITLSGGATVWYEISEPRYNILMFGAARDQAGVDSRQAIIDCAATVVAQATAASFRYGGAVYIPSGQYEVSAGMTFNAAGLRFVGDGSRSSTIKAQSAGTFGHAILYQTPPDATQLMTGVGLEGLCIDCNEVTVSYGYHGETVYDGVVYRDVIIARPAGSTIGFGLSVAAITTSVAVCQSIEIDSLLVAKTTQKGTTPGAFFNNCQEMTVTASKFWNGYGTDSTNRGTAASCAIQDCRTAVFVGCSFASAQWAGFQVIAQTRNCAGIHLIDPLFENVNTPVRTSSATPGTLLITDFMVTNPRFESPVTGGYNLSNVLRGFFQVGAQSITLDANCTGCWVWADALSQVVDSGVRTMAHAGRSSSSDFEQYGHHIKVTAAGTDILATSTPASGNVGLLCVVNDAGTLKWKQVKLGASGSGGSGFRALVVDN